MAKFREGPEMWGRSPALRLGLWEAVVRDIKGAPKVGRRLPPRPPPPKAGSHLLAWQRGDERGGAGRWWVHHLRDGTPARFLRGARPGGICGDDRDATAAG